ncbi:MAG TPA: YqaJ viral recombinase family protein [Streptomyces sp.]|nr:YqaJ viral recombinase family protein [Streptomyces sp.]
MTVPTTTAPAGTVKVPAGGRPDAPTARLILPADAPEEEWHAVRRTGIGGSDVAAILGLDRWKSPLRVWREKLGHRSDVDSEAAECGREMEEVIARLFARRTSDVGLRVAPPPGTLAHREHRWMLVNVDRYVTDYRGVVLGLLECKNRSEHQWRDWENGVPDAPALQAHWGMAVGGWDRAWVAALIGGNRLRWYRLERDEEMIAHLIQLCGDWWQQHVVDGEPPPPDGSKATTELLAHLWDVQPEAVVQIQAARAKELRARYLDLRDQIAELQEQKAEVANQMRFETGENEIAMVGASTAWTWKQNGPLQQAKFRKAQPELAAKYTRTVEVLDTTALLNDHPDVCRPYRGRHLYVPEKGI